MKCQYNTQKLLWASQVCLKEIALSLQEVEGYLWQSTLTKILMNKNDIKYEWAARAWSLGCRIQGFHCQCLSLACWKSAWIMLFHSTDELWWPAEVGQGIHTLCGLSCLSARGHIPCGRAGRTGQVPTHWSPVSLRCLHCCWSWICTGTLGRSRQALGCAHCTCGKVSVDCLTLSVASCLLPLCTHMKDSSRCKNRAPRFQDRRNLKSKLTQNLQGKFWIKFLLLQRKAGLCPWKCFWALKTRSLNISGALRGCLNVSSSRTGEYVLSPTSFGRGQGLCVFSSHFGFYMVTAV